MFKLRFFVLFLSLGCCSCTTQQPGAKNFYEGLKRENDGARTAAIAHFEKAMDSPNDFFAAAAADEIMSLRYNGAELSAPVIIKARAKATGSWGRVFGTKEKILTLLLTGDSRPFLNPTLKEGEAAHYALKEWYEAFPMEAFPAGTGNSFTEAEDAVINGRIAVSRSRYNEALTFFRIALSEAPELFFCYPDLLVDLGRAFQYTQAGKEGIELFLRWEEILDNGKAEGEASPVKILMETALRKLIPEGREKFVRFQLLFFAARVSRQRGESNIAIFEKALPFAPSFEHADACIWYILDSALAEGSGKEASAPDAIRYFETYIPQWNDDAYFFDVLDKLARELMLNRQWEEILQVFEFLRDRNGAGTAKYAWTIRRLIEEGFLETTEPAVVYMRSACDASGRIPFGTAAWYYRSLSAPSLSESIITPKDLLSQNAARPKPAKGKSARDSDAMRFLLGFFKNDAAGFAPRYIKTMENDLSADELYRLAEALGTAGQYQESVRLVNLYIRQDNYQLTRRDLELLFPRPFKELIEQYAKETGIEPSVLFALIRTESVFNSGIVSHAGAVGLTQLMPATAEETAASIRRQGGPDYTPDPDLRDPAVNIHIGATYLAYLNGQMEDDLLALLAYNGGMSRVRRWRTAANRSAGNLPVDLFLETVEYPETRNYGRSVIGTAAMYYELYYRK